LSMPDPIKWEDGFLYLLDQRRIPFEVEYLKCTNYQDVAEAIEKMIVRGAPAIGIAAAYGIVLASHGGLPMVKEAVSRLSKTRPTAVNLFWALEKMERAATDFHDATAKDPGLILKDHLLEVAVGIHEEERRIEKLIALHGQSIVPPNCQVLTHCNAGALATGGIGTALGVIRMAQKIGKAIKVYCDETRPLLQGARLSSWELWMDGLDVTVICDDMAAFLMKKGKVDLVIVGADRIASNGDTANKIGTYNLAVLCKYHGIPFYVAAPRSTIDCSIKDGEAIPIEERDPDEVRTVRGVKIFLEDIPAWNPAFDVTPGDLISGIITEAGILKAPYRESIETAMRIDVNFEDAHWADSYLKQGGSEDGGI